MFKRWNLWWYDINSYSIKYVSKMYFRIFYIRYNLWIILLKVDWYVQFKSIKVIFFRKMEIQFEKSSILAYINNSLTIKFNCIGFYIFTAKTYSNCIFSLYLLYLRFNNYRFHINIFYAKNLKTLLMDRLWSIIFGTRPSCRTSINWNSWFGKIRLQLIFWMKIKSKSKFLKMILFVSLNLKKYLFYFKLIIINSNSYKL